MELIVAVKENIDDPTEQIEMELASMKRMATLVEREFRHYANHLA